MCWYPLDSSLPFLSSKNQIIQWTRGGDAYLMASSSCVRMNARGVRFYPDHWKVLTEFQGWEKIACVPKANQLCETSVGSVLSVEAIPQVNPDTGQKFWTCDQANTMQILNFTGKGYDVSACDILSRSGDFVWFQHHWYTNQNTELTWWEYVLLCVLCIYAIRTFSNTVTRKANEIVQKDFLSVFICVGGILILCARSGSGVYITLEDLFAFWFVIVYILFDILVFVLGIVYEKMTWFPSYSVMISSFVMVVMRLYTGICTPYNGFVLWAVSTRLWVKIGIGKQEWNVWLYLSLLLDSFLLSMLLVLGTTYSYPVLFCILFVARVTAKVVEATV